VPSKSARENSVNSFNTARLGHGLYDGLFNPQAAGFGRRDIFIPAGQPAPSTPINFIHGGSQRRRTVPIYSVQPVYLAAQ
jgi:hypothetical protein